MKFTLIIYLCVIQLLLSSCNGINERLDLMVTSEENILIDSLIIKSLDLKPESFSGVGIIEIQNQDIVFVDKIFQILNRFELDGTFINSYIGEGQGSTEVDNIHYIGTIKNSEYIVIDNFVFHKYDNDTTKAYYYRYNFDSGNEFSKLENEPSGEYSEIYYLDWSSLNDNFLVVDENHFFTPIITEHPKLNALQHTEFYTDTYSIGKFDLNSGKLLQMGGKWPEIYLQNKFVPNLAGLSISSFEDKLYASYQIEPLVHVFDEDLVLTAKFGVPGRNMNTNYRTTNTIEDAIDNWSKDFENQGYYSSIYAYGDYVFRNYHPNGNNGETQLQIYQKMVLIGDVAVPKRFRVMGKIGDTFYADGIVDEENDILKVYTFQL